MSMNDTPRLAIRGLFLFLLFLGRASAGSGSLLLRRTSSKEHIAGESRNAGLRPRRQSPPLRLEQDTHRRSLKREKGKGRGNSSSSSSSSSSDDDSREVSEDDCTADLESLTRSVLVNLEGRPEHLDAQQIIILEDSFQLAYNNIGQDNCQGGSFRTVVGAMIIQDEPLSREGGGRWLQFGTLAPTQKFTVSVEVVLQCNKCAAKPLLVNDAARRDRTLQLDSDTTTTTGAQCDVPCEPPTNEAFVASFNTVLQEVRDSGTVLDAIDTVISLSELEEVQCDDEVNQIETSLAIEFEGDPIEVPPAELDALANGVVSTVNNLNILNDETCDPLFRVALSADVTVDVASPSSNRRSLQFGPDAGLVRKPVTTLYINVVLQCRGCKKSTSLFVNDAARRQLSAIATVDRRLQAGAAVIGENCLCAAGVEGDNFRPPTREEFNVAFNQTVARLIATNAITFIDEIKDTTEIEEISCASEVDERASQLMIPAEGDPTEASASDFRAVEEAVERALIRLYLLSCDPEVRTVVSVTFAGIKVEDGTTDGRRQLQLFGGDSTSTKKPFTLFINIQFSCRGCEKGGRLFGNDAARQLKELVNLMFGREPQRFLQQERDACFCDVNVVDDQRTPTVEEFIELFDDEVQDLDLPFILNTTSISESDEPLSLSQNPTAPAPTTPNPTTPAPTTQSPITQSPVTPAPTRPAQTLRACEALSSGQIFETDRKLDVTYVYELLTSDTVDIDVSLETFDPAVSAFLANALVDCSGTRRRHLVPLGVGAGPLDEVLSSECVTLRAGVGEKCFSILGSSTMFLSDDSDVTLDAATAAIYELLQPVFNGDTTGSALIASTVGIGGIFFEGSTQAPVSTDSPSLMPITTQPITAQPVTDQPITAQPITAQPITAQPITDQPVTAQPITSAPVPTTPSPVTPQPTDAPVTQLPTTAAPVQPTLPPVTAAPTEHPDTNGKRICFNDPAPAGGTVCNCRPGYENPPLCADSIDECAERPGPCDFPGGFCVNRAADDGLYACGCRTNDGWLNGASGEHGFVSCLDRDECTEGDPPCHPDATCTNLSPSFVCTCNGNLIGDGVTECKPPPTASPTSAPIDPLSPEAGCQSDQECAVELPNSVCDVALTPPSCICRSGYFRLGANCQPEDECSNPALNNCQDGRATCTDLTPGFSCACSDGWTDAPNAAAPPGTVCIDKDECSTGDDDCDTATEDCVNRTPPQKWECVVKDRLPTPPPASPPPASPNTSPPPASPNASPPPGSPNEPFAPFAPILLPPTDAPSPLSGPSAVEPEPCDCVPTSAADPDMSALPMDDDGGGFTPTE